MVVPSQTWPLSQACRTLTLLWCRLPRGGQLGPPLSTGSPCGRRRAAAGHEDFLRMISPWAPNLVLPTSAMASDRGDVNCRGLLLVARRAPQERWQTQTLRAPTHQKVSLAPGSPLAGWLALTAAGRCGCWQAVSVLLRVAPPGAAGGCVCCLVPPDTGLRDQLEDTAPFVPRL